MARRVIKAQYGVEVQEDTDTGNLFMLLDGYCVFTNGIPKEYKRMVDRSYNELVAIRKKDNENKKQ